MSDKESDEIRKLQEELEVHKKEVYRQTKYGIKQHEFAQTAIRERDDLRKQVKLLRDTLEKLFSEATYSGNIYTHDGWNITNPYLELPKDVEEQVREALRITE